MRSARLAVAATALLAVLATPVGAQTPLKPTGTGDARLPCRTPGRLISANSTSVVSVYSPSQEFGPPARTPGFYGCTRGHKFRRIGPDPISEIFGEGAALDDPALAGHFVALTTQPCNPKVGCFGGAIRSVSLATGKVVSTPLGDTTSSVRTYVTRRGVAVFSTLQYSTTDPNDNSQALVGAGVWRLGRDGVPARLAFDVKLDPNSLQVDDARASWLVASVPQSAPVG